MEIGITTTIPVEVLFAAGHVPVDLNNVFITHPDPPGLVQRAEEQGLPRNMCSWVKGIYSVIRENPRIKKVVAVTEGDCSNTLSMLDLLSPLGVEAITFSYPHSRSRDELDGSIGKLERHFGVTREDTSKWSKRLGRIREKALALDTLTFRDGKISGFENHLCLVSLSDFNGDPDSFERDLDALLLQAEGRPAARYRYRLGYCGVPCIYRDLYPFLQSLGAGVVFNEMQRQFALPGGGHDVVEQYLAYTYPYSYDHRLEDIRQQARARELHGIIHYVQSFCHHQIQDRRLRDSLPLPVLTLEGDRPGPVLERARIRIESFLEMLDGSGGSNPA